jgi:DNA-binding HxlR family transcriptional regulator
MAKLILGKHPRGTSTGRPIMVALDLLGRRMAMRVLWELRSDRLTFRALQAAVGTNPGLLNKRLAELREAQLIDHEPGGYGLTAHGQALFKLMLPLVAWADEWALATDQQETS